MLMPFLLLAPPVIMMNYLGPHFLSSPGGALTPLNFLKNVKKDISIHIDIQMILIQNKQLCIFRSWGEIWRLLS